MIVCFCSVFIWRRSILIKVCSPGDKIALQSDEGDKTFVVLILDNPGSKISSWTVMNSRSYRLSRHSHSAELHEKKIYSVNLQKLPCEHPIALKPAGEHNNNYRYMVIILDVIKNDIAHIHNACMRLGCDWGLRVERITPFNCTTQHISEMFNVVQIKL